PHQTLTSVRETIAKVVTQRPDRIAFYAYAHVPWVGKTGQRGFDENDLPSGEGKRALYECGRELLLSAGYKEVGMDHFALPHDPLFQAMEEGTLFRNFMGYVPQQVSPLIGLGVSSISDAWGAFIQNEKDINAYEERVARGEIPIQRGHILSAEDLNARQCILNLMTQFTTSLSSLPPSMVEACKAQLQEAASDHLVEIEEESVTVKEGGKPFIRNICMAFDARLQASKPETQIFSRTI
ncbi:MAG: coproporphyrinogen III oxidase, partial [Alphaproteobacteria bacterium CG_4_10_14_0_8_um_filter_53_9]